MEELISVIIPVYNVKPYLKECVDSVISQSYRNLEIILVDDGSNDGSEKICDEYCEKDSRVRVIHQENKGLSVARNIGIEHSNGDFLTFVDSDDWIHKDMLRVLYDNMIKYDADVAFCNYSQYADMVNCFENVRCHILDFSGMFHEFYEHKNTNAVGVIWGKIYKKMVFNNVIFPAGKRFEDMYVAHKLIGNSKKNVFIDCNLYYYRRRQDSIMNSGYSMKNLDILEATQKRMEYMKRNGYEYFYSREYYRYLKELKENYINMRKYFPNESQKLNYIFSEFILLYTIENRKLIKKLRIRWSMDLFYLRLIFFKRKNMKRVSYNARKNNSIRCRK